MGSYLLQATGFQSNASDSFSVYYSTTTNSSELLLLPCVNRNELLAGISIDLPANTYGLSVHNNGGDCDCIATSVIWPSPSPSVTPTVTPTVTKTPTPSVTPSITPTVTPTTSVTPSQTPSVTVTPTMTVTPSTTPSLTPTVTPTKTPSVTSSPSQTPGASVSPTPTPTSTPGATNFNVRLCSGGTTYVIKSNGLNPVVGKIYTMLDLDSLIPGMNGANCWEVLSATTATPNSTNVAINTEYIDCGSCTAVFFTSYTGSSLLTACNGTITTQIYYRGTLGVGTVLYEDLGLTIPIVPTKYVNDIANSQVYLIGTPSPQDGEVTDIVYCPAPTPTPTPSAIPVALGGSFTVYYGSTEAGACAATANTTIYYKLGDPGSLNNGQYYYDSLGLPYNGTFIELFTEGVNAYGSISAGGLFTQVGNCP